MANTPKRSPRLRLKEAKVARQQSKAEERRINEAKQAALQAEQTLDRNARSMRVVSAGAITSDAENAKITRARQAAADQRAHAAAQAELAAEQALNHRSSAMRAITPVVSDEQRKLNIAQLVKRAMQKLGNAKLTGPVGVTATASLNDGSPRMVQYKLQPGITMAMLKGATTSEPGLQQLLDVYKLMAPLADPGLIGSSGLPVVLGGGTNTARPIIVAEGSVQDKALAGFSTFVSRDYADVLGGTFSLAATPNYSGGTFTSPGSGNYFGGSL